MKIFTVILIAALLLTPITAEATGYPTIFAGRWDGIYVYREGNPDPLDIIPVTDEYPGLTYDGEHWWAIQDDTIFAFDYNGDLVSSFPSPAPDPRGLAFDGEYIWISCWALRGDVVRVYNVNLDGSLGPYPDFPAGGDDGLTVFQEQILVLSGHGVRFYTKGGSLEKELFLDPDSYNLWTYSITSDDEYLWICTYDDVNPYRIRKFDPETGEPIEEAGYWLWKYESMTMGTWSGTGIEKKALGKIKAFFK